ncbi:MULTISPECIES: hypothetical protein [Halomonas]|uniref:Transcriptional regulator n=1 Tax=Halomonas halophila TaxID=29573 RepID=A0ABQ0U1T7_9GAMM|nr:MULTISPECIES: hypothetical protein [Halomonas]MDR5889424.1 hypothetical protein [Halomonas salina]WJY06109.1 hypothetical protein QWG60_10355 [Halomonas halophila]GEK72387.1 hypothetical protein HHA04nite_09310 [Halomonas halophila]
MATRLAVITGDIIDSRRLEEGQRLHRVLETTLTGLAERHEGDYQRYRGDGFQLAIARAEAALDAAVALRAALIAHSETGHRWDARLAIAVGHDDWRPGEALASADGPVFVASGQALDALNASETHLALRHTDVDEAPCEALLIRHLDALLADWSPRAAEAVGLRLTEDLTQQALAERLGIRQPSVHKRLRAARWPLLADTLTHVRASLAGEEATP